ncbi:hypothetical protein CCMA1212_000236 [Trichoderma ghanense]|uniref:Uncharacterized protein n=1 Tax=Trichoderma ghanense TaxID=65468 RepID=A0ABY2HGV0_9HYPO
MLRLPAHNKGESHSNPNPMGRRRREKKKRSGPTSHGDKRPQSDLAERDAEWPRRPEVGGGWWIVAAGLDRGWRPEAALPDVGVPETTTHLTHQLAVAPNAARNPGPPGLHARRKDDGRSACLLTRFRTPSRTVVSAAASLSRLAVQSPSPAVCMRRKGAAATYEATSRPTQIVAWGSLRAGIGSFARPAESSHTISQVAVPTQSCSDVTQIA